MKHAEQVRNKHVRARMWKVVYRYNISTIRGLPLSMYARVTQRPQTCMQRKTTASVHTNFMEEQPGQAWQSVHVQFCALHTVWFIRDGL